ncbi:hypothetical protein SAMN05216188_1424 [Lentzea xinjiangensis]|uniref:Uncharacterized protein n=1 Tax=Lentzea xinjiangensis TaxID=402600 RepID=A0A1H9WSV8_9PSEU|nr:hypothetical protein [Lentzea xinjiangensis]SES36891.1 hypothetical protein SAMN05216188_1424 [Lentzea xinjiangensis]
MIVPDDGTRTTGLLRARLGMVLESVTEEWHWYQDQQNALVLFWLHFADAPVLELRGCGELLLVEESAPRSSYDMDEYGEGRVGPAQASGVLAGFVGARLRDAALIWGYSTTPLVGGVLLRFDIGDLAVSSSGDEWVVARGGLPPSAVPQHRVEATTITGTPLAASGPQR